VVEEGAENPVVRLLMVLLTRAVAVVVERQMVTHRLEEVGLLLFALLALKT
jgi:hypothetical protein